MKFFTFLVTFIFFITVANAQIINIPDADFKANLLSTSGGGACFDINNNPISIDINGNYEIEVEEAIRVYRLRLGTTTIASLEGISFFSNITSLECTYLNLVSLDLTALTNLKTLYCSNNEITDLNITGLNNLEILSCDSNKLTNLNLSGYSNLKSLSCNFNQLTGSLDLAGATGLTFLECYYNQLSNLYVSGLINLPKIRCQYNSITDLDLTGLSSLTEVDCRNNQLSNLKLTGLNNLTLLGCYNNQLTSLDLTGLNRLKSLYCNNNQLTNLNLAGLDSVEYIDCKNNQLPNLDLTGLDNLATFYCSNNKFNSLDLTNLNKLNIFSADSCPFLTFLILKNGSAFANSLYFGGCDNLQYVCVNENLISRVQTSIDNYGYTNCEVNTYCSFVPGGTYYTIQGNNRFDSDNNGCNVTDIEVGNLKFFINDGTNSGNISPNNSGNYSMSFPAGSYSVNPILENPTYFNISPATVNVTFPTQASPFTQDFCITANGVHPDLEITLLPLNPSRPGFDAKYKIIYKNKGNQTQSGSVNLTFDDSVSDLVTANPATNTQTTNNLSWDFTSLAPFETREISLTLNVNSPTETPAVNSGDILNFTAAITSPATDETPNDNTITFNQVVVNSFDPNDKTCVEGTTITPAMVGEYVHYVIRFENTGTFPAENIVVKDIIDTAKFDISTLIPVKGSHEFVTKISNNSKVEFIFEGINLPFDDANNDGFVAFKIKTKSSLVLGDTFSNSANIYFDYNFPIVTNTATTTVQTLGKSDFEFSKYFTLYPNPASGILNLSVKSGIAVNSIAIYNMLGQLVIAIPNAQTVSAIDVSSLKTGNYFIKMITDKGTSNSKFIKN